LGSKGGKRNATVEKNPDLVNTELLEFTGRTVRKERIDLKKRGHVKEARSISQEGTGKLRLSGKHLKERPGLVAPSHVW